MSYTSGICVGGIVLKAFDKGLVKSEKNVIIRHSSVFVSYNHSEVPFL